MSHYNTEEIKFHAILSSRISQNTFEQKCKSDVEVTSDPPLGMHTFIEIRWLKQQNKKTRYAITTGNIITDGNKKFYEVYPEVYDAQQARIISSALNMIKKAEEKRESNVIIDVNPEPPQHLFFNHCIKNSQHHHKQCDSHHAD